jgi:hypothetical protein
MTERYFDPKVIPPTEKARRAVEEIGVIASRHIFGMRTLR